MIKWVNVLFADHEAEAWRTSPKEGEEMKIQILSDLHCEFEAITPMSTYQQARWIRMTETPADVLIAAGDTHTKGRGPAVLAERFGNKKIIAVAGNHEYYGQTYPHHLSKIQRNAELFDNVHFLENQAVEIEDVVFVGCSLWTNLKLWESGPFAGLYSKPETIREIENGMNDYSRIKYFDGHRHRKLTPNDLVKVYLDSVRWLREQFEIHRGRKIVVITHMAPSFQSVPESYQQDVLSAA
ncbi:MAG: metallophosphoesterase, partial [Desulfatiglandaceae bacterium]